MRSFRIVVNPRSGGGTAMATVEPVAARLRTAGAHVEVVASEGLNHSRDQVGAAVAAGQTVVACGGDGMLASIAGAVVAAGGELGIVPSGRGNDFARMLGLLDDTVDIADVLLAGTARPVDVIDAGGTVVLGSVYAGVDSRSSELVNGAHWLPGSMQYPYAALRALLTHQPTTYTVDIDGDRHTFDAFSVIVANSAYYGKGMKVAPAAEVEDGVLDVVVLPKSSRLKLAMLLPTVYDGSHADRPEVLTFRGRRITIAAKDRVPAFGDGEPLHDLPITAEVRPGALKVLLPG